MKDDLPKQYYPHIAEEKWYYFWERKGFFHADPLSEKPPYCIVLPPPNVTGILHMGHALVDSLQDVLIRWKRMCGYEALWVPGTDHAGISTQTVVERHLIATQGKRRIDFTREAFLKHVWKWKEENETRIVDQLKKLGCSCDWIRHRFTMDKEMSHAVRILFKKMYDEKLIYRGDYLVNWDPVTETALADDEVEYEERQSYLWYIRYPLEDGSDHVTIATTRPETLLGDVAVAVSPKDKRYESLVGKKLRLPIANRLIPILADAFVDPSFGTGAVKITPAHDVNDYEMGQRHDLEHINLLNPDGTLNENGLEFEGLSTEEARRHVVARLKKENYLEKEEPHTHRVGVSYRSKAVIEPYLSKQWFVKMTAFKDDLIEAVRSKQVKLFPKNWEQTYFHWIENLRDWCISRQLWWGHRIPIWYHREDSERLICWAGDELPPEVQKAPDEWMQDEDVLDTWFSSALWPASTLGWPHQTNELKKFYPNSTLITGHDILFFWVARMIMVGKYVQGAYPFPETNLQGLIFGKSYWRTSKEGGVAYVNSEEKKGFDLGENVPKEVFSKWEKMSKSKGNVIDPIEMIQNYGADALRMALAASATPSMQIDLDRRLFEEYKNFTNKVWNGSRFVMMNISDLSAETFAAGLDLDALDLEDQWILSLLNGVIQEVNGALKNYHFDRAAKRCYSFFWDDFCAYYVELSKPTLFGRLGDKTNKQKVLVIVLLASLRLMHPFSPFITEEIFQLLKAHFSYIQKQSTDPYTKDAIKALLSPACIVAPYPENLCSSDIRPEIEEEFAYMREIIHAIRTIRAEMELPPSLSTPLYIEGDEAALSKIRKNQNMLHSLVQVEEIKEASPKGFHAQTIVKGMTLRIPLPQSLQEKELARLEKESEKSLSQLNALENKLNNKQFVERAPKELVQTTREKLHELQEKKQAIDAKLHAYKARES